MTAALTLLIAAGLLLFVVGRAAPMPSMSLVAPNGTRPRDAGWFTGLSAVVVVLAAVSVLFAVAGTVAGWAPGSATTTIRPIAYNAISALVVGADDVGDVAGWERPSGDASGVSGALLVELSTPEAAGQRIALGHGDNLDEFAQAQGAITYRNFPGNAGFADEFLEFAGNPRNEVLFNLEGLGRGGPWGSVQRVGTMGLDDALRSGASITDWELAQIYRSDWSHVQFFRGGHPVPSPFG